VNVAGCHPLLRSGALVFIGVGLRSSKRKEPEMNATPVATDLAKSVLQLAVADEH
jgi:hypothetical protein